LRLLELQKSFCTAAMETEPCKQQKVSVSLAFDAIPNFIRPLLAFCSFREEHERKYLLIQYASLKSTMSSRDSIACVIACSIYTRSNENHSWGTAEEMAAQPQHGRGPRPAGAAGRRGRGRWPRDATPLSGERRGGANGHLERCRDLQFNANNAKEM